MASLVDTFKMPLREIRDRFTRSEIAIAAWRSQEIAHDTDEYLEESRGGPKKQEDDYSKKTGNEVMRELGPMLGIAVIQ